MRVLPLLSANNSSSHSKRTALSFNQEVKKRICLLSPSLQQWLICLFPPLPLLLSLLLLGHTAMIALSLWPAISLLVSPLSPILPLLLLAALPLLLSPFP